MFSLSNVSRSYHGGTKVLDKIDLSLQKGGFLYVLGGSGAGKTSLLRLLATEDQPTEGVIQLFGYDLYRVSVGTLKSIRRTIGFIPQDVRLIWDLTVEENIALSLSLAGKNPRDAKSRQKVGELLASLGLISRKDTPAGKLSGGEMQRVAVARALAREPHLIVADEPTGAQDRGFTWTLMDLLVKAHQRGATVVVATHDQEIIRRVRNPCVQLQSGRVSLQENVCFY